MGGPRGYDAGKRIKGRKRHILVENFAFAVGAVVHSAGIQDPAVREARVGQDRGPVPAVAADLDRWGHTSQLVGWANESFGGWTLELVRKPKELRTFQVLPHRWKVERTLGWRETAPVV